MILENEVDALREKYQDLEAKYNLVVGALKEIEKRTTKEQVVHHIAKDVLLRVDGVVPIKPPRSH